MLSPNDAKEDAKKILLDSLLAHAKTLFEENEKLSSFGWAQFTTKFGERNHTKFTVYHSLATPNISGNSGGYIANTDLADVQKKVSEILRQFDLEALLSIFGDNTEVCIYKDLSYELSEI